jgi:hypothetical protein
MKVINSPPDPVIGAVMLLASILLLVGGYKDLKRTVDGSAFIWVGWFITALIAVVSTLVLVSNTIKAYLLGSEDLEDWVFTDDLVPGLYLGLIVILMIPFLIEKNKSNEEKDRGGEGT